MRPDGLTQQLPGHDDRPIRRAQVLLAAVHNRPHTLLQSAVLDVHPWNARKRLRLLRLPIDVIGIARIVPGAEFIGKVDVIRPIARTFQPAVFLGQRRVAKAVVPVPYHTVGIVDRHPDMARTTAITAHGLMRSHLVKGQHKVIGANKDLVLTHRPDPKVTIAIIRIFDD